ncbi:MAG: hypothetical protein FJ276_16885 [Planctomycetes bacterium]|nr:hypothetical protein [Planctomycetota bacterium]
MQVRELDAQTARQLGYEGRTTGVLVTAVDPVSIAAEKGVRPGMVVSRVGTDDVANVQQFRDAMAKQTLEKGILLLVATPEANQFIVLKGSANR